MITVPEENDPYLLKLLKLVNATHEPLIVEIKPEPGAEVIDCFNVVKKKVEEAGGKCICGWQVWKAEYLIEAEAHAVWETPEEELIDLTPKGLPVPVTSILFVEDERMNYQGKQIDSVRMNITNNKLADDLITVCKKIFQFGNEGDRANYYDLSQIMNPEQLHHLKYLHVLKGLINMMLQNGGSKRSQCPCGSGMIYKDCHGKNLLSIINQIK
jgi:hypothetical protein